VPREFSLVGQRKAGGGFSRYMTPQLEELVRALQEAQEEQERVAAGILQVRGWGFRGFCVCVWGGGSEVFVCVCVGGGVRGFLCGGGWGGAAAGGAGGAGERGGRHPAREGLGVQGLGGLRSWDFMAWAAVSCRGGADDARLRHAGERLLARCPWRPVASTLGPPPRPFPPPRPAQGLMRRFVAQKELWRAGVEAAAQLDALMSLAGAAISNDGGNMCRPLLVEPGEGGVHPQPRTHKTRPHKTKHAPTHRTQKSACAASLLQQLAPALLRCSPLPTQSLCPRQPAPPSLPQP
jgi:hypothetical protein